jgi:hypothetical protein
MPTWRKDTLEGVALGAPKVKEIATVQYFRAVTVAARSIDPVKTNEYISSIRSSGLV